ncbi:type IV secretory system conjugative DNA transfer family protein [Pseudooceanicola sp. 502str34]
MSLRPFPKITIGVIGLGATALGTILYPDNALAQGLFGNSTNYGYGGPSDTMLGLIRLAVIAGWTGIGFAIGWFMSPQAKELRKAAFGVTVLAAGLVVFFNNGALGWSVSAFLGITGFFVGLGYWLGQKLQALGAVPTTFGSASWALPQELEERGVFTPGGFRLGEAYRDTDYETIFYNGDRHGLLVAPTRSGKGVTQIITNLLTYEGSALIIDPKGENALITARARQEMGQKVLIVDPWHIAEVEGVPTARFNPLDWLTLGDPDITENGMLLADALTLIEAANDRFWDEEGKGVMQGLLLYLATDDREAGQRHLGRMRDLLLLDGEDLQALFHRMLESPHHVVASTGARCLQKEEKLLSNVMAAAQAQTHFLDSARIRENLSASDFRFEDLKTTPMTIYLVLPADRLSGFSRWLRLMIQQAITVNARNIAEKPPKPVLFILDEMPALGKLTMIEQAYGLMAGFGMQLYGVVQDLSQLKKIYGDSWETFIGNSGLIQYFGSRDRLTAEYFSALCGETTVWNLSSALSRTLGASSGSGGGSSSNSVGNTDTTAAAQRKLAYPDELMRLPADQQIIFIENMNPIVAYKVPWFWDEDLQSRGVNLH